MLGAIVTNTLFMLGACLLLGGLKYHTQEYNRISARIQAGLLFLALKPNPGLTTSLCWNCSFPARSSLQRERRDVIQRRAFQEKPMSKELLERLRKTKSVTLAGGVVRTLDDSELASVVGGMRSDTLELVFGWL